MSSNRSGLAAAIAFAGAMNGMRVLVCASSNSGTDRIALSLYSAGLDVARVYAQTRVGCLKNIKLLSIPDFIPEDEKALELVHETATVVATTCAASYGYAGKPDRNGKIKKYQDGINEELDLPKFDLVVVDEANIAREPEVLMPITLSKAHLVLLASPDERGGCLLNRLVGSMLVHPINLSD